MLKHEGPISGVACWGTKYVATAGYDNKAILWAAASNTPIARANHDHLVNQCAFTGDGRYLITASSDYSARIWDVPTMKLVSLLGHHNDDVEMAQPHPSERLVATASRDHAVRVFDFSGALLSTFEGHTADVISVEWLAVENEIISSSDDGTIRRWSLTDRALLEVIDMDGIETDTIALAKDGRIYAGNDAGQVAIIDKSQTLKLQAHAAGIKRLVLNSAQSKLLSLSYDRTARLWDTTGPLPQELSTWELPSDVWPRSSAFAEDGTLVFATFGETYRRYNPTTRNWTDPVLPTPGLNAVAASGGGPGTHLAIGDAGLVRRQKASGTDEPQTLRDLGSLCNFLVPVPGAVLTGGQLGILFNALTGETLHRHRSPLNCATPFSRDGVPHALVGCYTGEGLILREDDGNWVICEEVPLLANAVKGVAASDTTLFAVGADCSATWWDIETFKPIRTEAYAHTKIANGCTWVSGHTFASVSRDLSMYMWDEAFESDVIKTPHTHSVKTVAALREVDTQAPIAIATAAYDGSIAVYDMRTESWISYTRPTTSGISSIVADPSIVSFIASSYDGHLYTLRVNDPGMEMYAGTPGRAYSAADA